MKMFVKIRHMIFGSLICLIIQMTFIQSTVSATRHTVPGCCFPDQFHGKLSFSSGFHRGSTNQGNHLPTLKTLKFAVDFHNRRVYGEHFAGSRTRRRHFTFVADLRRTVQAIVIRESVARRCRKLSTGDRSSGRCSLDEARYRGSIPLTDRDKKHSGLVFALKRSFEEEDSSDLLHYRSLLLVKSDTCMPVMEMKAGDVDKYIMFHDMRSGLRDMDRLDHLQKECTNSGGDGKDDDDDCSSSENDDSSELLHDALYLYVLAKFFPRSPPTPCCGPQQWQGSLVKTITYTNTKDNVIGESVTSVPSMYVDHVTGQMSAHVLEYVNNDIASNITFIADYGSTTVTLYTVEWSKATPECTIFKVTGVNSTMRSTCMPDSAKYVTTVRVGDSPLHSTRLDVWNVSEVDGSFNFTAKMFVDPHSCMTIMEAYTWTAVTTEKVSGTIVLSDVKTPITDPTSAFALPAICNNVSPITITSEQALSAFSSVLAYTGLL